MAEQAAKFRIEALDRTASVLSKIDRRVSRFGKNISGLGKRLSVGATLPLAGVAAASLKAFDAQEKAVAQVRAGFKSTGNAAKISVDELLREASRLQKNSLFGDEDILANVTSQLQTFTNISEKEFLRTQQAALDLATRLDGDLKSASIQLGKALNDPVANLSALSRSGIQFSKDQKEVIKSLAEGGRLAEAQSIILDELERQYGGAAEAAAKAGLGPMKQLQNRIGDITERIGAALLPIIDRIAPVIDKAATAMEGMSDESIGIGVAIGTIAAAIGPVLVVAGSMISAFGAISGVLSTVAAVAAGVSFAPIIAGIAAVIGVGILVVKHWEQVKAGAMALVEGVVAAFQRWRERNSETLSKIGEAFTRMREVLGRIFTALGERFLEFAQWLDDLLEPIGGLEGAWKSLKEVFAVVIDFLTERLGAWIDMVVSNFETLAEVLEGNKGFWEGLKEIIDRSLSFILETVQRYLESIKQAFLSVDWGALGRAIIDGIVKALKNGAKAVGDAAANVAKSALDGAKNLLGIRSPSRAFESLGKFSVAGLTLGLAAASPAERQAEMLAQRTIDAYERRIGDSGIGQMPVAGGFDLGSLGGGMGGAFGGMGGGFDPGRQADLENLKEVQDQKLSLLREQGLAETELAVQIEREKQMTIAAMRQQELGAYQAGFGGILDLTRSFAGEQSGIYKTLFAASKAFAIAEAIIKIQQGIASAAAQPFPANLAAMGTVASATASILSTIRGTSMASFEGGGYTGAGSRTGGVDGRGGFPAILHPDETVIDHRRGGAGGDTNISIQQTLHFREHVDENTARRIASAARQQTLAELQQIHSRRGNRRKSYGLA